MPVESGITALAQRVGLEIKTLKAASIVADVVACYDNTSTGHTGSETDIAHYVTSALTDKDIVLVLKDETNEDQKAYYRFNKATNALVLEVAEDKIDHPIATSTTFGAVKPDNTSITINNGVISSVLPIATATQLGGVKVKADSGLAVNAAGELSVTASGMPIATDTTIGAVKINTTGGLEIAADGTLSVQTTSLPVASDTQLGVVKVDGTTISAAADGTLSVIGGAGGTVMFNGAPLSYATNYLAGVVSIKEDYGLVIEDYGVLSAAIATTHILGSVRVDGVSIEITPNGVISLNPSYVKDVLSPASYNSRGAVQISQNTGLKVDSDGLLSGVIATNARLGVVKVDGTTITADADGTISAANTGGISSVDDIPVATYSDPGVVMGDMQTIRVDSYGRLSCVGVENYTEEKWELTMEDGTTVTRTFLVKA